MGMLQEFKEFTFRGNVLDLAVGIVIGAAFAAIVNAVVDNILMPIIGMLTGGNDFTSYSITVGTAKLKYGMFIQATFTFIIIAFFLFLVVKAANKIKLKTPVKPPVTPTEELLMKINNSLIEIQQELKNNR